jgi:hypothetical protein
MTPREAITEFRKLSILQQGSAIIYAGLLWALFIK